MLYTVNGVIKILSATTLLKYPFCIDKQIHAAEYIRTSWKRYLSMNSIIVFLYNIPDEFNTHVVNFVLSDWLAEYHS